MFSPYECRLRLVCPAPFTAVLEMGGERGTLRRALMEQRAGNDSAACYDADGALLCVVMVKQWRARRAEFVLMIKRQTAAARMLEVLRLGRLVLGEIVARGVLVFAHIHPLNETGKRMGRLIGFRPGKFKDQSIWVHKG